MTRVIVFLAICVACGKSGEPAASGSGSARTATGSAAPPGDAAPAIDAAALSPKLAAARCDEPCLFLVDTPLDQLATAYKAACGKETVELGFDDCPGLDYARNCIYAAHGKAYNKKKWKKRFARKPWYEPRPAFTEAELSPTEVATIRELYHRGKACKKGVHVSAADHARVKAWFAKLPETPPVPPLVFLRADRASGDALVKQLLEQTDELVKIDHVAKLLDHATLAYVPVDDQSEEMDFADTLRAALPKDHAQLRSVLVDISLPGGGAEDNPISEGVYVLFVYDAKDKLVGISSDHYLWD